MDRMGFCVAYRFHVPDALPPMPEGCRLLSMPVKVEEVRLPVVSRHNGFVVVQHPDGTREAVENA